MAIPPNKTSEDNERNNEVELMVETVDFPHSMSSPSYGVDHAGTNEPITFHINNLEPSADNSVVLKGLQDSLIHLVADTAITETGILETMDHPLSTPELIGYHYYIFEDDMRLFSDQALVITITI